MLSGKGRNYPEKSPKSKVDAQEAHIQSAQSSKVSAWQCAALRYLEKNSDSPIFQLSLNNIYFLFVVEFGIDDFSLFQQFPMNWTSTVLSRKAMPLWLKSPFWGSSTVFVLFSNVASIFSIFMKNTND